MRLINLLREVLAEQLAKTELGEEIQYILENKKAVESLAEHMLEHIIKLVATRHPNNTNYDGWIEEIETAALNIQKDQWLRKKSPQVKYRMLLDSFEPLNTRIELARKSYYKRGIINRIEFPKELTDNQKSIIQHYYNQIVRAVSGLTSKANLKNLKHILKETE